ncbi:threonylcarbamoyl-AMP synthase [Candidatus Woesearchaeota archaeon]|nr:threonylcarbamoyl-AMP synthase [Candidatus Woesearchaeota archaeon]
MQTLTKDEFILQKEVFLNAIEEGDVFIHPTDTIYGIGCDATSLNAVKRVREIKKRYTRPFSVIAPSKKWIYDNCEVANTKRAWVERLPGPYTLILRLKNKGCIAPETNNGLDTIGVRIPDHWFTKIVEELGSPVVTTSANLVGEDYMTSLEDLNPDIKDKMDFIVFEGEKSGRPSKIVDLLDETETIQER